MNPVNGGADGQQGGDGKGESGRLLRLQDFRRPSATGCDQRKCHVETADRLRVPCRDQLRTSRRALRARHGR